MKEQSDFSDVERTLLQHAIAKNIPITGSFELSPLCNMDCDMCYVRINSSQIKQQGDILPLTFWEDLAAQLHQAGTLFLLLTGGEPLLYPDFKPLYLQLKKMGMVLTVNTNGTCIDEAWADFFADNKPRRINITLYGSSDDTYNKLCHYPKGFQKVIHAIKLLKERKIPVKIGCSAVRDNVNDIDAIIQICRELQVPLHIDSYMYPATRERNIPYNFQARLSPMEAADLWLASLHAERTPDEIKAYLTELCEHADNIPATSDSNQMTCLAGNCSFSVNWRGSLCPCVMLQKPAISLQHFKFETAWMQLQNNSKTFALCSDCSNCRYRPFCQICSASAVAESGSYCGKSDYLCELAKHCYHKAKRELNYD